MEKVSVKSGESSTAMKAAANRELSAKREENVLKQTLQVQFSFNREGDFSLPYIQRKLTVGKPNDRYEQEADRVADRVMTMSEPGSIQRTSSICEQDEVQTKPLYQTITPLIQRQVEEEEDEPVQTMLIQRQVEEPASTEDMADEEEEESVQTKKNDEGPTTASSSIEQSLNTSKDQGSPLPDDTREFMGSRFGADFSGVRVHTDSNSVQLNQQLNSQAFTKGNDIYFNEGKYDPGSSRGKHLLAHELTHTIQQLSALAKKNTCLSEPLIQRALKCSLDHIEEECKNAAIECASTQKDYCKKKYPKPEDIDTLYSNAIKGANEKKKDMPHAGKNLLHYLDASGTEIEMPTTIFENDKATKDQLSDVHREKFISGAKKRLKSGELAVGKGVSMVWTDTANAFSFFNKTDLGLAVGGYTLCSKVKVSVTDKGNGKFELSFDEWTVQAFDCYNWDPGKGVGIPGATDNDLCCLQNAGKGRHFKIGTKPWKNSYLPSMKKTIIS